MPRRNGLARSAAPARPTAAHARPGPLCRDQPIIVQVCSSCSCLLVSIFGTHNFRHLAPAGPAGWPGIPASYALGYAVRSRYTPFPSCEPAPPRARHAPAAPPARCPPRAAVSQQSREPCARGGVGAKARHRPSGEGGGGVPLACRILPGIRYRSPWLCTLLPLPTPCRL